MAAMISNNHAATHSLALNIGFPTSIQIPQSPQRPQRPHTPPIPSHHGYGSTPRHSRASSCASLLFDLEIDDASDMPQPVAKLPLELQRIVSSNGRAQALLWMHALEARDSLLLDQDPDSGVDVQAFAQALADKGHLVWLRNGTYQCPAETGLSNIKHTFVVASLASDQPSGPVYCVVDPNWQEHFQLSGAGTAKYQQLLSLLPSVFVGCADKLAGLVRLMCKEMEQVFNSRGVSLPPWRSPRVMQGRWLVNQAEDVYVPPTALASSL